MNLHVHESGHGQAQTVVFLHGGGVSGWMWQPQVERLPQFHCLIPDLPEHGQSMDVTPFTIEGSVEAVADLIHTRAHGGRAHVVGLSLGGQITAALLAAHPGLIDHAIISGALARPLSGTKLLSFLAAISMPLSRSDWSIRTSMRALGIPAQFEATLAADTRAATAQSFAHIMEATGSYEMPPQLAEVQVPTLVLVGEKEKRISIQSAREYLQMIPTAKGAIAPGVGHMWNMEKPQLFADTVSAWVGDQPLPNELTLLM